LIWQNGKLNTKGAVGSALDKLDDKAVSAQNATYNALKNNAVPGIDQPGPIDIPEPPVDPGTTEAPIVDPTSSAEGVESPIQDPNPPADAPVSESQPPAQPDSSQQKFQKSMNQMNYMNQQMQQQVLRVRTKKNRLNYGFNRKEHCYHRKSTSSNSRRSHTLFRK